MIGVRFEQVEKTFQTRTGGLRVLDGVSFTVEPGEFVSILGPSGSGKSVSLHIIGGLIPPSAGRVQFVDAAGKVLPEASVRLGFVFQTSRLMPWLTVADNIRFVLRHGGQSRREVDRTVSEVLEVMGLSDFPAYYPHQISGGMQQRVAIARALAFRPDVILMDEPFSHLDELTARRMREEVALLWRERRTTVIFVTHDIVEASYLSQRVMLLTPKPTRLFAEIPVELPYPRKYGSDALFDAERTLLRRFEDSILAHETGGR